MLVMAGNTTRWPAARKRRARTPLRSPPRSPAHRASHSRAGPRPPRPAARRRPPTAPPRPACDERWRFRRSARHGPATTADRRKDESTPRPRRAGTAQGRWPPARTPLDEQLGPCSRISARAPRWSSRAPPRSPAPQLPPGPGHRDSGVAAGRRHETRRPATPVLGTGEADAAKLERPGRLQRFKLEPHRPSRGLDSRIDSISGWRGAAAGSGMGTGKA